MFGSTGGNGVWQPASKPAANNSINVRMMDVREFGHPA
jgi:hypothetical protein